MNMENKLLIKEKIARKTAEMRAAIAAQGEALTDACHLSDYRAFAETDEHGTVWTKALQRALREHEVVIIDPAEEIYYIDDTVVIPSDRRIEATGAVIRLTPACEVLMLRNEHTADGTNAPIDTAMRDRNITIHGGRWEESREKRLGYGKSGRYTWKKDGEVRRPFYGISTCMLFNNIDGLRITDAMFSHTAGFAVQVGDIQGAVFENIGFDSCYADGLHINGRTENVFIRHIFGEVGDDLVALNAYDWQDSSVNFGAIGTVWCEDLDLWETSRYQAFRLVPGLYTYADGSTVDCAVHDIVVKNVRGIRTFKMYFQTPAYTIGETPERGDVGSGDNIFFEDIDVDLISPVDGTGGHGNDHEIYGVFGAFEVCANIGYLSFENIRLVTYPEKNPYSYLVRVGPKALFIKGREIFDPYVSCRLEILSLKDITVNGVAVDMQTLVRAVAFEDINGDGLSTGHGEIGTVICK